MQPAAMLVFVTVWLFILWFGSIALEATGMERSKARFQALSALTNTGFTTSEAENIVSHPRRRYIVGILIFLGSVGIALFLILLFVMLVVGIKPAIPQQSAYLLVLAAIPAATFLVLYFLGVTDKLATVVVKWLKRSKYFRPEISITEIIYKAGEYSLARLTVGKTAPEVGSRISDTSLSKADIRVLAIEREDKVMFNPEARETVRVGDHLIYLGRTEEIKKTMEEE